MAPVGLALALRAVHDLAIGRALVRERFANVGAAAVAAEIEPLLSDAALGDQEARARRFLAMASFVARALAEGRGEALDSIGEAAAESSLGRFVFAGGPARALLPRARLFEIGVATYADLRLFPHRRQPDMSEADWRELRVYFERSPFARELFGRRLREPFRRHHDPIFIGRLLDQRWIPAADVVAIAARRPTVPAITLAVATRDRFFVVPAVREAIAENPFSPAPLARCLSLLQGRTVGKARAEPATLRV